MEEIIKKIINMITEFYPKEDVNYECNNDIVNIYNYDYSVMYRKHNEEYITLRRFDDKMGCFVDIYTPCMQNDIDKAELGDNLQYDYEIKMAKMLDSIYEEIVKEKKGE